MTSFIPGDEYAGPPDNRHVSFFRPKAYHTKLSCRYGANLQPVERSSELHAKYQRLQQKLAIQHSVFHGKAWA